MPKLREVHDILEGPEGAPVAIQQVIAQRGNQQGMYIAVCPWCGHLLLPQFRALTFGQMYGQALELQVKHMETCSQRESTVMRVQMPDGTLGLLSKKYQQYKDDTNGNAG